MTHDYNYNNQILTDSSLSDRVRLASDLGLIAPEPEPTARIIPAPLNLTTAALDNSDPPEYSALRDIIDAMQRTCEARHKLLDEAEKCIYQCEQLSYGDYTYRRLNARWQDLNAQITALGNEWHTLNAEYERLSLQLWGTTASPFENLDEVAE